MTSIHRFNPSYATYKYLYVKNWNGTLGANDKSNVLLDWGEAVGETNPNFQQQIAQNIDASTGYTRGEITSFSFPEIITRTCEDFQYPKYSYSGSAILPVANCLPLIPHDPALKDLALGRVKRKLASSQNEFKALIPMGEIKELRGLVRSTAESSFKVVLELANLKKGKGSARGLWAAISDSWLNYSFAIAPTVADTIQLASTISDFLTRQDHTAIEHAGSRKQWNDEVVYNSSQYVNAGLTYKTILQRNHTLTYRYTVGMNFNVSAGNQYSALDAFGIRKQDIASAIYELTPYSWLLDYFTTTGDWLEDAFEAPSGSTKYVVLNTHYDLKCTVKYVPNPSIAYWQKGLSAPSASGSFEGFRFSRERLASLPHRALRIKSVDEIGKNAVNKIMNLTSLLAVRNPPHGAWNAHRWASNAISR